MSRNSQFDCIRPTFVGHKSVGRGFSKLLQSGQAITASATPLVFLNITISLQRRLHFVQGGNAAHGATSTLVNVLKVYDAFTTIRGFGSGVRRTHYGFRHWPPKMTLLGYSMAVATQHKNSVEQWEEV